MKRYHVHKATDDLVQCTKRMKKDGITLEQIETELDYRDRANDNRWDDNLFQYSTQELETIAYELWSEN